MSVTGTSVPRPIVASSLIAMSPYRLIRFPSSFASAPSPRAAVELFAIDEEEEEEEEEEEGEDKELDAASVFAFSAATAAAAAAAAAASFAARLGSMG